MQTLKAEGPTDENENGHNGGVERIWNELRSAESTIRVKPRPRRNDWFDHECRTLIQKRNKDRQEYLARSTRTRKQIHEDSRREADKLCRRKISEKAEDDFQKNNIRHVYKGINFCRKGYKTSTLFKSKAEKIIAEMGKLSDRWKELISELLNHHTDKPPTAP